MNNSFFLCLFMFALLNVQKANAQSKHCDELVYRGDTTICRNFVGKRKLPSVEHFYVKGKRIFTRDWNHKKNGEYYWKQQISKGIFVRANGPGQAFYSNGAIMASTFYAHGKKIGPCREYYQSGVLKQTCERHNKGKRDGINTFYHENGELKARFRWEDDRLREVIASKDEAGNDLLTSTFKDGNGDLVWQEKGKPLMLLTYKNGKLSKRKRLK